MLRFTIHVDVFSRSIHDNRGRFLDLLWVFGRDLAFRLLPVSIDHNGQRRGIVVAEKPCQAYCVIFKLTDSHLDHMEDEATRTGGVHHGMCTSGENLRRT